MLYNYIHEMVSTFFIDYASLSAELQIIVQLFELWGLFIVFKWCLIPVTSILKWLAILGKDIFSSRLGNDAEWRDTWTRKKKKSIRKQQNED